MYKNHFQRRHGRPNFSHKRQAQKSQRIDVSRFINRTVITESMPEFVPEHTFSDFPIEARLKTTIALKGYEIPTPIQDKAIPHILNGKDVVGIANTGTGKTAAFLIPIINKILKNENEAALVIVPTRELAQQIDEEFKGFTVGMRLHSVICIGGASMGKQMRELKYHNHVVIGTPGRLKDLIERKLLNLSSFNTVVLDEADRMLDMGFINDMRYMLARMPANRHTLFFSATLSPEIQKLVKDFLCEPVNISVKTAETAQSIEQDVVRISGNKVDTLHDLLIQKDFNKVLVFGKTKHGVEKLAKNLVVRGFKAESIHGNKNQNQRQRALQKFKSNEAQVLVATDVAARGLDIDSVSHVINYDLPQTYEDYIHRIGRTGRGGKRGKALTFIEQSNG